jgi:thermostable 8-oxoguanine DNA glycosylase
METTENIERFKKALDNNKFTMFEELTFCNLLVEKYNFISKAQYAKKHGISHQGVEARLKATNDPYIILAEKYMIVS